jgi:tetratricopeptide (TPR) repeat protein
MAYQGAARRAVPGRTAVDGISRTSLGHGETPDEAVGYLVPLAGTGVVTAYQAQLQIAQVRREAGQVDAAWMALLGAAAVRTDRRDAQLDLEHGLLLISLGRVAEAEPLLKRSSTDINQVLTPLPEGSEPHYWLAYAEGQLGRPELAVEAARAGLANLPLEQASLRAPLLGLLGDNLMALGRPSEALAAYQDGRRAAPNDRRFADGIARAQAALRSR